MDFSEPEEYVELRAAVRGIAGRYGIGTYAAHGRTGDALTELWRELGRDGFLGVNVPAEYGGGGAGLAELAVVAEEVAAAGCPLLLMLVSSAIGVEVLRRHGSEEQRKEWLPGLADGTVLLAFAVTEPDAGSNTHRLRTVATPAPAGDGYLINGSKYYISGVDQAAAILTVTRTGLDEATGRADLSLFLVPTDAPGLSWTPIQMDAQLPDRQFTVHFDDVAVPAEAAVGPVGGGWKPLFDGLNPERVIAAALAVGIGRYAVDAATRYVRDRSVWRSALGTHQAVSHPLARARIAVDLAGLMTAKAAWLHDRGEPAGEAANMAKYAAAEAAGQAIDAAIQAHGGNGLSADYGLIPLWGMARLLRIAPVNSEMVLNHIAQHTLGLPRSY